MIAERKDPLAERRRIEAEEDAKKTFGEVAEFVIKRDRDHWGATSLRAWKNSLEVDAKRLSDLNVADVSVDDVKRVVMPIFERDEHDAA